MTLILLGQVQASEKYERYSAVLGTAIEAVGNYIELIDSTDEGDITGDAAAEKILQLATTLSESKAELIELTPELSKEEQEIINEEMKDPELIEIFSSLDEAVEASKILLDRNDHYDSSKLERACEAFLRAYQ